MWVMAVATILGHRCMLPKIRTALLGVAVKTGLVESHLGELPFARCAMCAMAATAVHFALPNRVGIRFEYLRALLLVAIEANLRLRRRHQDGIGRSVTGMAIGAGDVIHIMIIAMPAEAGVTVVATDARTILVVYRRRRARSEIDRNWWALLAASNPASMIATGSMAGLALQLAVTERTIRIRWVGMRAAKQGEGGVFLVAGETGISSFAAVVGLLTVSSADGQGR